jgi:RNA polymerase sigma-70 factor (TIGR02960 family)
MIFRPPRRHTVKMMDSTQMSSEDEAVVAALRGGDQATFTHLVHRHRRELHVHCYRMLGSFSDAEDQVQETLMRAWRKRETFEGRSSFRAWLYGIATHSCLDFLAARRDRVVPEDATAKAEVLWLQPYPDRLLEPETPHEAAPDAVVVARETIQLGYLVAIQLLAPKQRAVLILSEVLDWSAKEIAELLELSVTAVNSALQRARVALRERSRPAPAPDPDERALLERYVQATERSDVNALAEMLREDVRSSMPSAAETYAGRDVVVRSWVEAGFGTPSFGQLRCVITSANKTPAVACYLRKPGDTEFRALAVDILQIENGAIIEITTFGLEGKTEAFGLPPVL